MYLNIMVLFVFRRNSVGRSTTRSRWWMRNGTTVRPKSSRTTEMYVRRHDTVDLHEKKRKNKKKSSL